MDGISSIFVLSVVLKVPSPYRSGDAAWLPSMSHQYAKI